MQNFFSSPSRVANVGYNGFDMSHTLKFSSTTGELLPVYYDLLQPGDKVNVSAELRTRTMPLQTAAMGKITEQIELFFVPITQIYQFFPEFFYGIQDFKTSFMRAENYVNQNFPHITISDFASYINNIVWPSESDESPDYDTIWSYYRYTNGTSLRLMELLGIPVCTIQDRLKQGEKLAGDYAINPMFAAAYQKIYSDYYRLSDRELNDPRSYNLDDFFDDAEIASDMIPKLFRLRYRPWKKDFFTNIFTSPLMGQTSIGSNTQVDLTSLFQQWLNGNIQYSTKNESDSLDTTNPTQLSPSAAASTNHSRFLSPTSIRTSFAVQKLLEVTRRAGKHYDKQTLAHFGVDVPDGINGEVSFLGSLLKSEIAIGDVISTSSVPDGSTLGEVGGKGYGYGRGNDIKFTAPSHGILMAIYSCSPEADYSQIGFDKLHTYVNSAAFPRPEFDNLGMQPLFGYQVEYQPTSENSTPSVFNNRVEGWQYRWSELKTKYNRVVGALAARRSLDFWSLQRNIIGGTSLSSYLIPPFALDGIMLVPYEFVANESPVGSSTSTIDNLYDTDPLIHNLYIDCKKSSKMSTYGLEQL